MFCRPCQREHAGAECPINEQGEPSPPSVLIPAHQLAGYAGYTFTSTVASGTGYGATLVWTVPPMHRPPDDDGLAGVPALAR